MVMEKVMESHGILKASKTGLPGLCVFFPANYALFFGELCAQNPELCGLCNIF